MLSPGKECPGGKNFALNSAFVWDTEAYPRKEAIANAPRVFRRERH
jgi:hypothetical protein